MGRTRGFLWLMIGFVIAILAGFVGFVTLTRAEARVTGQPVDLPTISVVVAARDIPIRAALTEDMLTVQEVEVNTVPAGAARRVEDVKGQLTLVDLYAGEYVLGQRLLDPNVATASGRMALVVAEDEVLMAFPTEDLMSQVNVLKAGDQVDLLFSLPVPDSAATSSGSQTEAEGQSEGDGDEKQVTINLLQNTTISAVVTGESTESGPEGSGGNTGNTDGPRALLLAISPQDALVLKHAKDVGGKVDIVLRAPGTDRSFPTEPVDIDYLINRYQIPVR